MPSVCLVQITLMTFSYIFPILVIYLKFPIFMKSPKQPQESKVINPRLELIAGSVTTSNPASIATSPATVVQLVPGLGYRPPAQWDQYQWRQCPKAHHVASAHTIPVPAMVVGAWGPWNNSCNACGSFSASLVGELEPSGNLRWLVRKSW